MTPSASLDSRLRDAAFAQLRRLRTQKHGVDMVTRAELDAGFEVEGERIRLCATQQGIWKPAQLGPNGAALTILTAAPHAGRPAPYDDKFDEDTPFFTYKYEGTDPGLHSNRAVRRAMELGAPLIYLLGIVPGHFQAFFPVFVTGDAPDRHEFRVELDADFTVWNPLMFDVSTRAPLREYTTRAAKARVHQRRFRELIMRAYGSQCAICALRHENLLDAAHIIADSDLRGLPEVPNGLALCKLHHSAYDLNILGIDPDCVVHVSSRILEEHDGPMLQHGLKETDGKELRVIPHSTRQRPNRDFLAERFEKWKVA